MKILLATNKFQQFAGAEIVTLEIAEYFAALGHVCTVASWFVGAPMKAIAERQGIAVTDRPDLLHAFDYDLVCANHHIMPVLQYDLGPDSRERTFFAWRHLSVVGRFEQPGLVLQNLICDRAYAVSEETRHFLLDLGVPDDLVMLFPNPAPAIFHEPEPRSVTGGVRSVLVVSNHAPPEILDALFVLHSQGIKTLHIGRNGAGQRRVDPALLRRFDVIITIGKSAQYAICCGTPVFVYDHFGGPGYLTAENFDRAAWFNFSGRCTGRVLSGERIAAEVLAGHPEAWQFAERVGRPTLDRFLLSPYLDELLSAVACAPPNEERVALLRHHQAMLRRESIFCAGAGAAYRGHHVFKRRFEAARAETAGSTTVGVHRSADRAAAEERRPPSSRRVSGRADMG